MILMMTAETTPGLDGGRRRARNGLGVMIDGRWTRLNHGFFLCARIFPPVTLPWTTLAALGASTSAPTASRSNAFSPCSFRRSFARSLYCGIVSETACTSSTSVVAGGFVVVVVVGAEETVATTGRLSFVSAASRSAAALRSASRSLFASEPTTVYSCVFSFHEYHDFVAALKNKPVFASYKTPVVLCL